MVMQATKVSTICGMCFGAYMESREEYTRFMERNKHEMFQHPRAAQSALMVSAMVTFANVKMPLI
jgi:hypothetical protein